MKKLIPFAATTLLLAGCFGSVDLPPPQWAPIIGASLQNRDNPARTINVNTDGTLTGTDSFGKPFAGAWENRNGQYCSTFDASTAAEDYVCGNVIIQQNWVFLEDAGGSQSRWQFNR